MHVITGQHVTRLLIKGVDSNNTVANPTAGGNQNGDGSANGNPDGFGFGPSANTPPLGNSTSNRFARRQDPSSSSLQITGVQVRICQLPIYCYAAHQASLRRMRQHHDRRSMLQERLLWLRAHCILHSYCSCLELVHRHCLSSITYR